ncbi:MAG TPA: acetyl-coenzyme A synthetase N-terminal domain-containing protein, partial [Acidimicrobiales bacterium]|nr:acetyl-coenzyme A synthetase N-terminal domain-containing protein [Acidimicrobiales bacterium]
MDETISTSFVEDRTFDPPLSIVRDANFTDPAIYAESGAEPDRWWAKCAEALRWRRRWDATLDWSDAPFVKWFVGGRLNVTESCLDAHLADHPDRVAYYWEGEQGDRRVITYRELTDEVCRFANALDALGVEKGDRVA